MIEINFINCFFADLSYLRRSVNLCLISVFMMQKSDFLAQLSYQRYNLAII